MKITLFGIPNCNQVKSARTFLDNHQIEFHFVDFKKAGVTPQLIHSWLAQYPQLTWIDYLNKRGTTWRQLSPDEQAAVIDAQSAAICMAAHPSLIKRPVLVYQADKSIQKIDIMLGFSEENYRQFIQKIAT